PLRALRAATADNATLLGLADRLGSLEEGMLADLLLVKGELADSIEPLMKRNNVTTILKGGRAMPRLRGVLPS
ncbi:MAG: amidohydrolase family protein, partial [Burkholderiales bacterium]